MHAAFGTYHGKHLVYLLLCDSVSVLVRGVAEIACLKSLQEQRAEAVQDKEVGDQTELTEEMPVHIWILQKQEVLQIH